jgi:hypothetical protein
MDKCSIKPTKIEARLSPHRTSTKQSIMMMKANNQLHSHIDVK